jgi:hypothetical protein
VQGARLLARVVVSVPLYRHPVEDRLQVSCRFAKSGLGQEKRHDKGGFADVSGARPSTQPGRMSRAASSA